LSNTAETDEKKPGIKGNALKIAGAGYSIGDLTMAQAAKLRGEKGVLNGAAIWLAGGLAAARYGNPNPDKQMEIFASKLEVHLKEQGVEIPDDVRARDALLQKPGFIRQCENFLYQHPSELLNAAYAIGAAFLLKDGIKDLNAGKKLLPKFENGFGAKAVVESVNGISKNFWMGALVGGGALSGLFIKEDPHAREHAKDKGVLARMGAYIQEKPLRLTGTLYGANNIFTVLKTVEDYSNRGLYSGAFKPHHFSGTTAGTYILSNILLSTVSRDSTSKSFTPEQLGKLEQAAAEIIAAQPDEKRHPLVKQVADYMAHQKGVNQTPEALELEIHNRVHALTGQGPVKPKAAQVTSIEHHGTIRSAEKEAALA